MADMPLAPDRNDAPLFPPLAPRRVDGRQGSTARSRTGPTPRHDVSVWLTKAGQFLEAILDAPAHLRWAALGFAAGAIFWHFVGFWTFMSHIMFSTPETARRSSSPPAALAAASSEAGARIETGSIQRLEKLTAPKLEPSCTAVLREPHTGKLHQSECRKLARAFRQNTASQRQNRQAPRQAAAAPQQPIVLGLDPDVPLKWP